MKREVTKPEKVALCRECHGTGKVRTGSPDGETVGHSVVCPNCDGSGRVLVSCRMTLAIRPYRPDGGTAGHSGKTSD